MPGYPCAVCCRESAGITINLPGGKFAQLCSIECGVAFMRRDGVIKHNEPTALRVGGDAAGAYLDKIKVYDLSRLSADQWQTFCATLFTATCAELARLADDEIPF